MPRHPPGQSPLSPLIQKWKAEQLEMAERRVVSPLKQPFPRFVAGADAAFADGGKTVLAVVLVWDRREKAVVEVQSIRRPVDVPYIPTYLSFREGPAIIEAVGRLKHSFGVICFDGHGVAHPRRCGLATHVGMKLDVPSIGVAKSRLIGTHADPPPAAGATADLVDEKTGDLIGVALRTRDCIRPIYVSEGHRVDLASAVGLVLACVTRFRIPEPTRVADQLVGRLKRGESISTWNSIIPKPAATTRGG
jgi:deoxyribonuclease V